MQSEKGQAKDTLKVCELKQKLKDEFCDFVNGIMVPEGVKLETMHISIRLHGVMISTEIEF